MGKISLCCETPSEILPSRAKGLSFNWVVLTFFLGTSIWEEVLEVSSILCTVLKSTFFAVVVTPLSDAEGPTVLGGPAVEVISDGGPNGRYLCLEE